MILELTQDEAKTLIWFIEYGLETETFNPLSLEEETEKSSILNILEMLKKG